jgi:4-hydroxy-3-methylbut-2-enyl diphosphate reductase IspH
LTFCKPQPTSRTGVRGRRTVAKQAYHGKLRARQAKGAKAAAEAATRKPARGFCAGVERAIRIVELSLVKYGAPVYVCHEIVHNRIIVERHHAAGRHILPIGHADHPEVKGTLDQLLEGAVTLVQSVEVAEAFAPKSAMPLAFITFNVPRALAS